MQVPDQDGMALVSEHTDIDDVMYFQPVHGGAIEFKRNSDDELLGRITVGDDITAEVNVADEYKAEAHASIADGVKNANNDRVQQLAQRLKSIKKKAPKDHRWRHNNASTTGADLARVMVALRDAIDK